MLWLDHDGTSAREIDGHSYSYFCQVFREFERWLSPVMRQLHAWSPAWEKKLGQDVSSAARHDGCI
jgi:hypothetical protein